MTEALRAYWEGRTVRERWMLGACAAVIAGLAGWYGLIVPLGGALDASEARVARASALVAELETAARQGIGPPAASARKPVGAIIDETAGAVGLVVERRREEPDGRVTLWLAGVDPTAMMGWLKILAETHGVAVSELTASRRDGGLVDAQITLERP